MNKPLYAALLEVGCDEDKAKAAANELAVSPDMAARMHAAQLLGIQVMKQQTRTIRIIGYLLGFLIALGLLHAAVDITKLNRLLGDMNVITTPR